MAFHYSRFGAFGGLLARLADKNGYLPEPDDDPWDFDVDHGLERTHDDDGELTEYGEWWEDEKFPEWVALVQEALELAEAAVERWQKGEL